jgi:hypothetical protein
MLGGYRSVVLVNAASFVVAAALAALLRIPSRTDDSSQTTNRARPAGLFRDRRYLAMTVVNGIVSTHMALLSSGLPLWIVTRTSLPAVIVPILTGVNAAVTMLLQVPVAKGVRTTTAAAGALLATGGLLAGCCFTAALLPLIAAPAGFGVAVVSVLFLTAAELAQSVGGWKLSYDLAPEAGRAIYLARFSLGTTIQQLGMPLVLTALVFPTGVVGWLALAGFLVAGGAAAPIVLRLRPSGSARNWLAIRRREVIK